MLRRLGRRRLGVDDFNVTASDGDDDYVPPGSKPKRARTTRSQPKRRPATRKGRGVRKPAQRAAQALAPLPAAAAPPAQLGSGGQARVDLECSAPPPLPVEILGRVFSMLGVVDVLRCLQVSKHWRLAALSTPSAWARIAPQDAPRFVFPCLLSLRPIVSLTNRGSNSVLQFARELDFRFSRPKAAVMQQVLQACTSVAVLRGSHCLPDIGTDSVCVQGLQRLEVSHVSRGVAAKAIRGLSKCPLLTVLDITDSPDCGHPCVQALCESCPNLVDLNLSRTGLTPESVFAALNGLPKLRHLVARECEAMCVFGGEDPLLVIRHDALVLEALDLLGSTIPSSCLSRILGRSPALTHLAASGPSLHDAFFPFHEAPFCLPLCAVQLWQGPRMHQASFQALLRAAFGTLEVLSVRGSLAVCDEDAQLVATCCKLRELDLSGTQVTDVGVKCVLGQCPALRTLRVDGCRSMSRALKTQVNNAEGVWC